MNRIATAANASLISNRSMSPTSRPARASALRDAGAGPVSMIVGSAPDTAADTGTDAAYAERWCHAAFAWELVDRASDGFVVSGYGAAFVAAGKVGGAVDTTGGYVDLAVPPALAITGALTVAAWIRPAVLPTTGADYVFGRRGATAGPGYRLGLRPQGVTFIAVTDQSMSAEAVGPTVPVGQWTHIAGVYAPGVAARVYVGGKLEKDQQATNIAALGGLGLPTRVGIRGDGDPATNFRGAVDELRVYKRALDAAEIAALATP